MLLTCMIEARRICLRALVGALVPIVASSGARAAKARNGHSRRHAAASYAAKKQLAHRRQHRSLPLIVVDPGHGGADPGTVGQSGTLEKTVTLATALELARVLNQSGRYRVLLTRHADRFVSLAERAAFAPAHHAALIISLHADASPDHSVRGSSVYIRSDMQAGMEQAGLANTAQAQDNPPRPEPGSAWLRDTMIDKLNDEMEMTAAPARAAHLWVLADHDIPGVLVEMGFLSNRQDEKLMRNPRHRLLFARLIRDAVDGYFTSIAHGVAYRT